MHYEINISKECTHVFATHPRSITSRRELELVYPLLKVSFSEVKGYKISVTREETTGHVFNDQDLKDLLPCTT